MRSFSEKQIALVQNFAAQAVIAIANARLFNELRQSLQQQTATADVLKVISRSTFELQTVLNTLVKSAARLCEADVATMHRQEGINYRAIATYGPRADRDVSLSIPFEAGRGSIIGRTILERKPVQVADVLADSEYAFHEVQQKIGFRTVLGVPLLREGHPIGAIVLMRLSVQPFTDQQIELVTTFADQAVIAIENVRLFEAEQKRTRELSESLEQQTATSEVLRVISSSPGELAPVFKTILANAVALCGAELGNLFLYQGNDAFCVVEMHGASPTYAEAWRQNPVFSVRDHPHFPLARLLATKQAEQITDLAEGRVTAERDPRYIALMESAAARTMLLVPMLKNDDLIGAIVIYGREVKPFDEKQIALVQNFAAQAVIAIENTRLLNELRQRTADLSESLEQQTATSEVLRVVSSSPGDLQPVFSAMLESAARLCDASFGNIFRWNDGALRLVATYNTPAAFVEARSQLPLRRHQNNPIGEMLAAKSVLHVDDLAADERYTKRCDPNVIVAVELGGIRTFLAVPMLKDNELIGALIVYRQEVRPFSDKQIELVKNFAAQAVIAIENARLLNELRESLDRQTATADILRVIAGTPEDSKRALDTIAETASRMFDSANVIFRRLERNVLRVVSAAGPSFAKLREVVPDAPLEPPTEPGVRCVLENKQIVVEDRLATLPNEHGEIGRALRDLARRGLPTRSQAFTPLLREGKAIGVMIVSRGEVRSFQEHELELMRGFADQAVIAIENAKLLDELRRRTADLTESLEQQTATSEVLRVISSSPSELTPVFQCMLANATRLCDANFGTLNFHDNGSFPLAAAHNAPEAYVEYRHRHPLVKLGPRHPLARVAASKQVLHIADMRSEPLYLEKDPSFTAMVDLAGARTLFIVPVLKDNDLLGAITIFRQEVRPFTEKQIELVRNFAAQAVIAIENTRLLNELRQRTDDLTESLEQQTATSKVLEVISRSAFDLQSVFETVAESSVRLCGADHAFIWRFDGELLRIAVAFNASQALKDFISKNPTIRPGRTSAAGRVALERRTVHIPDTLADPDYSYAVDVEKIRTVLAVPILKGDDLLGAMAIYHLEGVRPFTNKQIALVETFADQAAIAIDNARLLDELRHRTDELSESLQQQTATADVLKIISRSTFDLQIVLQTLVESAARFCAADKATIIREKGGVFYNAEAFGYSREFMDYIRSVSIKAERGTASGRALVEGRVVHITDVKADPEYTLIEAARLGDFRTILCVPMLREGVPIGVLTMTRSEVQPFTDKQIELVTTFADQAAIAIENVRLFDEIQDKSRLLEEASQHKSQFLANMSHELRTPLNAILGYTELMADGAYGEPSEKMMGVLKRLEANGKHLLGLINDVLDLSPRSKPANSFSNSPITAFGTLPRPSAARLSR